MGWRAILGFRGATDRILEIFDVEGPIFACQLRIRLNAFLIVPLMKRIGMVYGGLHEVGGNFEKGDNGSDQFIVAQFDAGSVCGKQNRLGFRGWLFHGRIDLDKLSTLFQLIIQRRLTFFLLFAGRDGEESGTSTLLIVSRRTRWERLVEGGMFSSQMDIGLIH